MKTVTLYKGILLILFILTFLPLITIGLLSYDRSVTMLEEKITESNLDTLDQVRKRLDSFVKDMDNASSLVASNRNFKELLSEQQEDNYETYVKVREFVQFSQTISDNNPNITNITIYDDDGRRIDNMGRYLQAGGNMGYSQLHSSQFNQPALMPLRLTEDKKWVISYARPIFNVNNGETTGTVVVEASLQEFWDYLEQVSLLDSGYVLVVNNQDQIVYQPSRQAGQPFQSPWGIRDLSHNFFFENKGEKELVIPMQSSYTNWTIYGVIPYKEMVGRLDDLRNMVLLFVFVLLGALSVVAWLLHVYLVKPIRKLQALMRLVEQGELQVGARFRRKDEIGALGRSFNRMVRKIEQLIEDVKVAKWNESEAKYLQKQAQYTALQARIAPHFLYNTLDGISWQARDHGMHEISLVIDNLAGMLRYSLECSSSMATLAQEFENTKMYGEIIEFRAGDSCTFFFDLPDSLSLIQIPRFSLQPLVENAVQHGLEPLAERGRIKVSAYREKHFIIIGVEDTGSGISEERLQMLQSAFQSDREALHTGAKGNGLINVHQRIRMNFGEEYGLRIARRQPNGFVARIFLPDWAAHQKSEDKSSSLLGV